MNEEQVIERARGHYYGVEYAERCVIRYGWVLYDRFFERVAFIPDASLADLVDDEEDWDDDYAVRRLLDDLRREIASGYELIAQHKNQA